MNPLISVIIPIYKVELYLQECVDSIRNQTYRNLEIILVDDGSPDNCPKLCDKFAKEDSRIIVIHKPNGGASDARNVGLERSTGKFILFVDGDDWWDNQNGVQELIDQLQSTPQADLIFFQNKVFIHNKYYSPLQFNPQSINGKDKLTTLNYLLTQSDLSIAAYSKLIRKELLISNNIKFETGLIGEDIDWSFNLYIKANKLYCINSSFYVYRKHIGSVTASMKRKNFLDLLYIINKWRTIIPELSIPQKEKNIYLGFLCYEYSILLGLLYRADVVTRKELKAQLKPLTYLFQYDINHKTHKVALLYKLFGFNITCWILQQYIKHRPKTL